MVEEEKDESDILSSEKTGEEITENEILREREKFIEGLNKYYKLKNEYQETIQNEKKNIIAKMKGFSLKEKRIEFKKLKPKCVNCKRPVGSIFITKVSDDNERQLVAMCGDRVQPCPFNINIHLGYTIDCVDERMNDQKEISEYKKKIIMEKNDLLFGYITSQQAVANFESMKKKLESTISNYEFISHFYNAVTENPNRIKREMELQEEVYTTIDSMKQWMREFDKTGNHKFVVDVVESYINTMIPKLRELMKKKYVYSAVDYNEEEKKFILVQKKITSELLELNIGDEQKIVSMKLGSDKIQQKPKKPKFQKQSEEEEFEEEFQPYLEGGGFPISQKIEFKKIENTEDEESDEENKINPLENEEYDSD